MEVRPVKKIIEQEVMVYIAEDGKEFTSESECMKYEADELYLNDNRDVTKCQPAINDLNNLLSCVGVRFRIGKVGKIHELSIEIDEEKIESITNQKVGRPVEHEIDFDLINNMKADGKSNKEIYTSLGMSKSLFYLKMKEHNELMQ